MSAAWISADWPAPANVVAGTTTRSGGVSQGAYDSLNLAAHVGDDPAAVAENRRRFRTELALPQEPLWLRQMHGTRVASANAARVDTEADAIVADSPDAVCAVLTADCLPVLLAAEDGSEVAAAHAGWRGLSAGILEHTVTALRARPAQLIAWLGPAISQPAFEVGDEVREAFVARERAAGDYFSENARGRWQADLYGLARLSLGNCGVTRVFGGGCCTHGDPDRFFSHRRDGRCGRMASVIYRLDDS